MIDFKKIKIVWKDVIIGSLVMFLVYKFFAFLSFVSFLFGDRCLEGQVLDTGCIDNYLNYSIYFMSLNMLFTYGSGLVFYYFRNKPKKLEMLIVFVSMFLLVIIWLTVYGVIVNFLGIDRWGMELMRGN